MSSAQTISIQCNGELCSIKKDLNLSQVLNFLGYQPDANKTYAIAVNNNFIPRSHYTSVKIHAEDRLEIIAPMQGG